MSKSVSMEDKRREFLARVEYVPNQRSSNHHQYTGKVQQRQDVSRRSSKDRAQRRKIKKLIQKIKIIGMSGLIAFGSYTAYKAYANENKTITLEQSFEMGETPQTLGIDANLVQQIQEIQNELENANKLSNSELKDIGSDISQLQLDVIKSKIANTTGKENITLRERNNDGIAKAKINEQIYIEKDIFDNKNTISKNIANEIQRAGENQRLVGSMYYEDIDRSDVIKQMKDNINSLDKFAAGKMSMDEKGNITLDKTTQKEYEKANKDIEEER